MNVPMAGRVVAGVVAVLLLAGCEKAATTETDGGGPAVVEEPAAGSEVARVTLTEDAAARIDVQTTQVRVRSGHKDELQIPYAAVLYDPDGQTWTYTNPEPLVFLRAPIDVVRIDRSRAVLSKGPLPGTKVVTVGAAELLGAEYEVGEE
jgi:uncharacterized protein YcfL